ncbi:MAG: hypothetical protein IJG48_01160 [Mogibacterium sp.]|nr:hypothetical protein [Mogibacterium sp.]
MKKRQAGILILALLMVLSMAVSAFAVSGTADSDSTDYNSNRTGNSTAVRQTNSSNKGTIRLGKILTVNQQGKFPNIEDFVYKITPVAAWDNANQSTSKSGAQISREDLPMPEASAVSHHNINNIGPDRAESAPWSTLVAIGNFKNATEDNTSGIYGDKDHEYVNSDDASNLDLVSDGMRRTRVTDVSFTFNKAGYYMYKVEEVGSSPNGSIRDLSALKKDVAGVDYDDNTYYVVFYVCNKEDDGNTIDGVYVHTITSWTNGDGTDFMPDNSMRTSDDLADAKNWLHDLMESQDVDSNYNTDNGDGGHDAALNTGRVDNISSSGPSSVTHDNLGKVGISTPENPNYLEAYRMWNGQITHDVVLRKNVTGNLGDLTKEFVFEVTLTGLEANQTYTTNEPAVSTEDRTSAGVKMYEMTPAACLAADGKSFTTDSTGSVSFKVKLRDDDILVLNALPRSASYKVKEQASDHVAQYNIISSNLGGGNDDTPSMRKVSLREMPVFTETGHTPGGTDAAHLGKANTDANKELSTETEFVDRYDDTVTIIYQNNRDLATLTGIAGLDYMVYAAALAMLSAAVFIIVRRRREYAEEDRLSE